MTGPTIIEHPGHDRYSSAEKFGELIKDAIKKDPDFYLFSPDETTSNRLEKAYEATSRAWGILPKAQWDLPESEGGRIIELLSENTLFATMVGHNLVGGHGMMTSYEAFFTIIASQLNQYQKFLKQKQQVSWQKDTPALNLLSTSTCWRQDHNGFSHQSPSTISLLLDNPSNLANLIFPVDDVAAAAAFDFMQSTKNVVNFTTFNKTEEPRWIDKNHAKFQYDHGASIFGFISDDNPDYVFTAAGDIATREVIRAIEILKQDLPEKRYRFVNIAVLSYGAIGTTDHKMTSDKFNEYFTIDKPIIANFHGYTKALRNILVNYAHPLRIMAHGFEEEGSTTTPFEMLSLNRASRFHLCIDVARLEHREDLVAKYQTMLQENSTYACAHGEDLISVL